MNTFSEKLKAHAVFWPAIAVAIGFGVMLGFNAAIKHDARDQAIPLSTLSAGSLAFQKAKKKSTPILKDESECTKKESIDCPRQQLICTHRMTTGFIVVAEHC
jgi:hypothetical protein